MGSAAGRQPPRGPAVNKDACLVCGYLHPAEWDCPEMESEGPLRIAIERLQKSQGLGLQRRLNSLQFLHLKLVAFLRRKELKRKEAERKASELGV